MDEMTQATARFERIKSAAGLRAGRGGDRAQDPGRASASPAIPSAPSRELVKQFGVNRSTVREGIRLLEQSGLVLARAEPAPVGGGAALPPARHPHDAAR